jgi:hypothetical protein
VPGGVLRGYCRGMALVWSTRMGTAERMGWSCVIDQGLCWKVVMFD